MNRLESYRIFFDQYREFVRKNLLTQWQAEKADYNAFLIRYQRYRGKMTEILARESPHYNIFSILSLGHHEVRLHSPFLANLLNPKGSHGQGSLFLNTFLKEVLKKEFSYDDLTHYSIRVEFPFRKMPRDDENLNDTKSFYKSGRIDIFIRFLLCGERKAIIIENKIFARDQDQQLMRYENYAVNGLGYKVKDVDLVYLSPYYSSPSAGSYPKDKWKSTENRQRHFSISYRTHVCNWLVNCENVVKSEKVKFILNQYIQTI